MPVSRARAAAFDILLRVERESSYASELLHSAAYARLSGPDHALATELVMGVLRWGSCVDEVIAGASSQPIAKLDLEVVIALRLAVYQFRWLDRIPQRAALYESVELVKRAHKRSAAGFVNAVLRKLSAEPRVHEMLADREGDSPEALARRFAHPRWMVERWVREYGLTAAREICRRDQCVPTTAIRLRTPAAEAGLRQEGIGLVPGGLLASARRVATGAIRESQVFRQGEVVIQDEGSQLIAALVGRAPGGESRILDCCAAPGGKTLAIADRNPRAMITAVELHPHRARLLRKLLPAAQAGERIQVVVGDARNLPISVGFDRVLADVPCSGTGTLARNPEIKWRLGADSLAELRARQSAILRSALGQLASGGRLLYATCSLEKEENEDVVEQALAEDKSFRLLDCRAELERLRADGELTWADVGSLTHGPYLRTIPGIHPCDGFFGAILERA
jgi:16S rRNA (cytosine967-C5)-methyltransferase